MSFSFFQPGVAVNRKNERDPEDKGRDKADFGDKNPTLSFKRKKEISDNKLKVGKKEDGF